MLNRIGLAYALNGDANRPAAPGPYPTILTKPEETALTHSSHCMTVAWAWIHDSNSGDENGYPMV